LLLFFTSPLASIHQDLRFRDNEAPINKETIEGRFKIASYTARFIANSWYENPEKSQTSNPIGIFPNSFKFGSKNILNSNIFLVFHFLVKKTKKTKNKTSFRRKKKKR